MSAESRTASATPSAPRSAVSPAVPDRRHRGRRIALALGVVLAVLLGLFYSAGGWYFAGRIESGALAYSPSTGTPAYNLTITALPAGAVSLKRSGDESMAFAQSASYALMWPGGSGHVGPPTTSGPLSRRPGPATTRRPTRRRAPEPTRFASCWWTSKGAGSSHP